MKQIVVLLIGMVLLFCSCSSTTYQKELSTNSQTTHTTEQTKIQPNHKAVEHPLENAYVSITPENANVVVDSLDWNVLVQIIPSDSYQSYPGYPKTPIKATLYKDNEVLELDVSDTRLVKLMNFYYNSQYHDICNVSQGNITMANEISSITDHQSVYLEIEYDPNSYYMYETVDFYTGFDKLIVMPHEFVQIDSDASFSQCPFTAFGRYPLYGYEDIDWLALFGF